MSLFPGEMVKVFDKSLKIASLSCLSVLILLAVPFAVAFAIKKELSK